ncbi:hypothetical protein DFH06DRAFT_468740 [Mycena polygramma]|nr:hypothetical protein DFH06DRAFT_468740 [Mycena polygramma]
METRNINNRTIFLVEMWTAEKLVSIPNRSFPKDPRRCKWQTTASERAAVVLLMLRQPCLVRRRVFKIMPPNGDKQNLGEWISFIKLSELSTPGDWLSISRRSKIFGRNLMKCWRTKDSWDSAMKQTTEDTQDLITEYCNDSCRRKSPLKLTTTPNKAVCVSVLLRTALCIHVAAVDEKSDAGVTGRLLREVGKSDSPTLVIYGTAG